MWRRARQQTTARSKRTTVSMCTKSTTVCLHVIDTITAGEKRPSHGTKLGRREGRVSGAWRGGNGGRGGRKRSSTKTLGVSGPRRSAGGILLLFSSAHIGLGRRGLPDNGAAWTVTACNDTRRRGTTARKAQRKARMDAVGQRKACRDELRRRWPGSRFGGRRGDLGDATKARLRLSILPTGSAARPTTSRPGATTLPPTPYSRGPTT